MNLQIDKWITEYLNSKKEDWASSTQDSERHRLNSVKEFLDGKPERLWTEIQKLGKYSRKTTWSRITSFYDFLIDHGYQKGPNPYRAWRREKGTRFKNAYTRRTPDVGFTEALARVTGIHNPAVRSHCLFLLYTGARFGESLTHATDGTVIGKGGRIRALHIPEGLDFSLRAPYSQVRRALAQVGLKPHTLRKILLTELARKGADPFVLCEVAGWTSLAPATSYITAIGASKLMKGIQSQ